MAAERTRGRAAEGVEQLQLTGVHREGDEPTEHVARLVSMLMELLRESFVSYDWYCSTFGRSERQYARDLKHLRSIGGNLGLKVSNQKEGRAYLLALPGKNRLKDAAPDRNAILKSIARALGTPVARQLGIVEDGEEPQRFLVLAVPTLVEGSSVATTFEALEAAHERNARVRFRYRSGKTMSVREVEPYSVLVRSGRYYLIGFDVAPRKGWRYFALDQIVGPVSRAGTFTPRLIPAVYQNCDAVGMLQSSASIEVTIRLSPIVAASATSRVWQKSQRVEQRQDGSAEITFTVNDVGEAIRWALGFGPEAQVIAPAAAVEASRDTVAALQRLYRGSAVRALAG